MQVLCEKCNAVIEAADLDLSRNLAKCSSCGNVFNCAAQLDGVADVGSISVQRDEVAMPKGIRLFRRANALRIVHKWFGQKWINVAAFCVFWNGFTVFWFHEAFEQRNWIMATFGSIHVVVGLGILYATLAGFLNTTTITVMKGLLEIVHGPIRVPGNKKVEANKLEQLYTKQHMTHGKNGVSITYELRAVTTDGTDEKLLSGLEREEQSLFIEQEIEKFLEIEDRPVRGETGR